jgi:hypothetical protein
MNYRQTIPRYAVANHPHLLRCSKSVEELRHVGFAIGALLKLHYAAFIDINFALAKLSSKQKAIEEA